MTGKLAQMPDELRHEMREAGFKTEIAFPTKNYQLVATRHDNCIVGPPGCQKQCKRRSTRVGMQPSKTKRQRPSCVLSPHDKTSLTERDELIRDLDIIIENDKTQILRIGNLQVREDLY